MQAIGGMLDAHYVALVFKACDCAVPPADHVFGDLPAPLPVDTFCDWLEQQSTASAASGQFGSHGQCD